MCHPSRRFTVLLTAYVCLLEKYIYIYINIESLLGGWYFHYNAWNDNTIVERGNSNIVIRGMVKGSKQNTKSRLNSGKTLSLPLFSLHVHFPSFVPSLSLSLSLHLLFLLAHRSATTLRNNVAFSQTQSDFVSFSFRRNIEFPSSPRCLIWKLNPLPRLPRW